MANDHTGLSGFELFPLEFNWASSPKINYDIMNIKKIYQKTSTSTEIMAFSESMPYSLNSELLIKSKKEEKTLLDFFDFCKGRLKKFWVTNPLSNFKQYSTAFKSQSFFNIYPNNMEAWFTGNERIHIFNDQNSAIKKIINVERYPIGSEKSMYPTRNYDYDFLNLQFDYNLLDDWFLTDDNQIRFLKLVRFDQDDLVLQYNTDSTLTVSLKFQELVYEYSEVGV